MSGDGKHSLNLEAVAAEFETSFLPHRHVVLAVSGGPDSVALMHLAAGWKVSRGGDAPSFSVVTVDHGLRAQSAAEAATVALAAQALGFPHATVHWAGGKPKTGLQAAAREARYRLIAEHLKGNHWQAFATGHTQDDQAETLLMRLARGSGVDGLAAMRRASPLAGDLCLLRPLLKTSKRDLIAFLRERGLTWIDDPGNLTVEFERGRLRAARSALDSIGLVQDHVALSADRLGRARDALDWTTGYFARAAGGAMRIDDLGFAEIEWDKLLEFPQEIRLRILVRLLAAIGGGGSQAVSLGQLEAMTIGRGWQSPLGLTLAGTVFSDGTAGRLMMTREYGRSPLPTAEVRPGQTIKWDHRFTVTSGSAHCETLTVKALGSEGVSYLSKAGCCNFSGPKRATVSVPGFWRGDTVVAAPLFGYVADGLGAEGFACCFAARPFSDFGSCD